MKFALKYNPDNTGLRTIFREWQITTLKPLWANPEKRYSTKEIWNIVRRETENEVSRATVYHFLDEMLDKSILMYDTGSGRGGIKILFYSLVPEEEFKKRMAESLIKSIDTNLLGKPAVTEK